MDNNLQIFSNPDFGNIRTIIVDNDAWFVAADVCKALDLTNPTVAVDRLDEDEKAKFNLGYGSDATIISEAGLYSLVLSSRKPEAKAFKRWVTHEVIPTIRKTGMYMTSQAVENILGNPDAFIAVLQGYKDEREKRLQLEAEKAVLTPKADFADAIVATNDSLLVREFAKILCKNGYKTGERRLYDELRKQGFLMSDGPHKNEPYQKYIEKEFFEIHESVVRYGDRGSKIVKTTKILPKGQMYFIKLFTGKNTYVDNEQLVMAS